ncbi:MAG TPA: carboxylating nicotinate-nucleotide diphosphorylase, partial [Desulfobaccales bacterium]|nr:carboxylating nicotinate-nucleotide diphosphorylase [Desulfobaccales bacterium]
MAGSAHCSLLTAHLDRLINLALEEDLGPGDVTTQALIPADLLGEAHIRAKQTLVVAGVPVAARVFRKIDSDLSFEPQVPDGQEVEAGAVLARLTGPVAAILSGERVALNFLQRLSGIATFTRQMTAQVAGTGAILVDTRKTTPGWRVLEKYAVRLGGARNHRYGLYDGVLIKNNHLTAVGSITAAVSQAKKKAHHLVKIEVEVTDLEGLAEALDAGADLILLDNLDDAAL